MNRLKNFIVLFIMLSVIWVILVGSLDPQEIAAGIIISLIISFIFYNSSVAGQVKLNPKSILYSIAYFFYFIYALVRANFDVAYRVIHPALPIRPGIVKVRTKLKSKLGRAILASSITLTPGTLTVEIDEDSFYIHWINVHDGNVEDTTRAIVSNFEKYLEVIFG